MTFHLDEFAQVFIREDDIQKYTFSKLGSATGGAVREAQELRAGGGAEVDPGCARRHRSRSAVETVPQRRRSCERCIGRLDFWQQLCSSMQITESEGWTHTRALTLAVHYTFNQLTPVLLGYLVN